MRRRGAHDAGRRPPPSRWNVPLRKSRRGTTRCCTRPTGKKLGYGELAADAGKMAVPASDKLRLKDPAQFRYIGKEGINIVDGFDITTGRAKYGQDVRLPGQKYAVIARPPVMGGKVDSYDFTDAMKVPGVFKVVQIAEPPHPFRLPAFGGIAVVADNTWAAIQGPQGAEDRLGRRRARHLRFEDLSRRTRGRPRASQARCCATRATSPRRIRRRRQESRGGILHSPSRPCDDGAAFGDRRA